MSRKKPQIAKGKAEQLALFYLTAKEAVIDAGFADEIDWQADLSFEDVSESSFLREAAWVVLCSGMRETTVRKHFPSISRAFCNWSSATAIVNNSKYCRRNALAVFSHPLKIEAIISVAIRIVAEGYDAIHSSIRDLGVDYLQSFAFIGPITAYHLAKNIGLNYSKADRHLVRVAFATGYASPFEMCSAIASIVQESIAVIDLVIWRYATLDSDYLSLFNFPSDHAGKESCCMNKRALAGIALTVFEYPWIPRRKT